MSNFFYDLLNRTAMLGRVQSDLRNSQAGELNMVNLFNREQRARLETKERLREVQDELREYKAQSESFRRLARKYGEALGKSQDERNHDRRLVTMDLAEEDPDVARTKLYANTKADLGIS